MYPPLEINLAEALDAQPLGRVDEVTHLDRIAGEERNRLEQAPPPGVLTCEWLDEARQLGEEEVDEWARHELGDAAAATLLEDAPLDDRPLVVGLDVMESRLVEQGTERAVHEPRMPVADVGVGPDDDVAARLVEGV